ncbi:MAG: hypothetical protein FJ272_05765, partial [Planctomycetes bacterium]|nr:hypothetical protein [Planctomycetota bacterium]
MVTKFLTFTFLIYGTLLLAAAARARGLVREEVSARLMRFAILFLESSVAVLSFWVLDLSQPRLVVLTPLVAALVSLACFGLGRGLSRLHEHQPKSAGSYVACSMFSNVGLTLGGFLCFMLLGEQGLSVALLYSAYFIPFFFSVGFGVARSYNSAHKA